MIFSSEEAEWKDELASLLRFGQESRVNFQKKFHSQTRVSFSSEIITGSELVYDPCRHGLISKLLFTFMIDEHWLPACQCNWKRSIAGMCTGGGGKWGIAPPPNLDPKKCSPGQFPKKTQKYAQKIGFEHSYSKNFRGSLRSPFLFLPHLVGVSAVFEVKVVKKKYKFSTLVFDKGKWSSILALPPL